MSQVSLLFTAGEINGVAFVGELEQMLSSIASQRKGSARPADVQVGELWIDDTNDPSWTLKVWDGAEDITVLTINTTDNSVLFPGLEIGADVQAYDANILKANETATLTKGFPATAQAMVTAAPTPATGALQIIDTSGGAVNLGVPAASGVIRFIVFGGNALNPSASFDSIDGEYDTTIGLAQGEISSSGTKHFLTIVNKVAA